MGLTGDGALLPRGDVLRSGESDSAGAPEWPERRLKHLVRSNPTKSEVRGTDPEKTVSFVPMDAVGEYGGLELSATKTIGDAVNAYTYFRDGDVLVAKITPCFENGKGALAGGLESGIGFGTTELHVLRPRASLDARFLFYLTISYRFRKMGAAEMYGAGGQKRISEEFVEEFCLPLPPLPTQRAIASFLDRETEKIDTLIEKKRRLLDLLEEKRTALITRAVTRGLDPGVPMKDSGVEWLGEIPEHWAVPPLRRLAERFVDYRGKTPPKVDAGVPLVTASNIEDGAISFSSSQEFVSEHTYREWMVRGLPRIGDVLITTEAPLGEVALVEDPNIALAQRIILVTPRRKLISSDFLRAFFLSGSAQLGLRLLATGSTAIGVSSSKLRGLPVPVPPLAEQERSTGLVRETEEEVRRVSRRIIHAISLLQEYRTSLISHAVTGKIDIHNKVPA